MTAPRLAVDGLEAGYGRLQILFGVSLTVAAGELRLVFGPNGAGKSTLAKALAGLVPVRAGRIQLDGRAVTRLVPEARVRAGLGYVPQLRNVFASLTVLETLEVGAVAGGAVARARIAEMLETFPVLAERRHQTAGTLSGGERQQLAIARALMTAPRVLVLDEPSAGVAPALVERLFALVRGLADQGTAIVMVEQNARQALAFADRGTVLDAGAVRFEDRAQALLSRPDIERLYLGADPAGAAECDM